MVGKKKLVTGMDQLSPYAYDLDEAEIRAQRRKARELRGSQWWKRRCAKGFCHYCGEPTPPKELTMDHIVPIARGGKSTKGNIVPACKACNTKKKQLLPMEWEAYLQEHQYSEKKPFPAAVKKESRMKQGSDPVCVLVVDGEEGIRQGAKRIIDRMDFRTLTAGTGEDVLGTIETEEVNIVLLDLQLPDMDGMELLGIVREKFPHILIIVISSFATVETAVETMKKGAFDFIAKPFEPDQLRRTFNQARKKLACSPENRRPTIEPGSSLAGLDREKSRTHTIINSLPNGVMVTDARGRVVLVNPTFLEQMDLPRDTLPGRPLEAYIADENLRRFVMETSQGRHGKADNNAAFEFPVGNEKYMQARSRAVLDDRDDSLGAVVTLEDITAIKVLDRLKREFVAKVSHELRSPLSTIHELLAAVLSDIIDQVSSTDAHLLTRAKEKTQGLISLIGDLLDLSRIESGAVCEAPKPVFLDELLENIIDFLGTRAAAKRQHLALVRPKEPLPAVKADPLALESIFGNLITNAINYTDANGKIEVHIARAGTGIQVQVIDNGFGIEERYLDKIFERFYRVKTEKTRYITGTGLGLPIVKGLVDSLGGRISVESTPDKGTAFTVMLPTISE